MKPLLIGLAAMAVAANAAATAASSQTSDILRGKQIALSGDGRAAACAACHKLNGAGEGNGAFPRISSQAPLYLYRQLRDFADSKRRSGIMTLIARQLSDTDMRDVAAYYASVTAPSFPPSEASGHHLGRGAELSDLGSNSARIPACTSCHGPEARGYGPTYPYLAGQFANYIKGELRSFKSGARSNDPDGVMRDIASGLSSNDIDSLGAYFASLPAPSEPAQGVATMMEVAKRGAALGSPGARQSANDPPDKSGH